MKNVFNVSYKNSSKAAAVFFIFLLIVAIIASLVGCGNDNPVNNGNNPPVETAIYSIDKLEIRSTRPFTTDTTFNRDFISDLDSFSIVYTLETNTPNSLSNFQFIISDSVNMIYTVNLNESFLNGTYGQRMYSPYGLCTKHLTIQLAVNGNGGVEKYLIFKDFKVYKIN